MAWRLKLVPDNTNIDFFKVQWLTFGASIVAVVGSIILWATVGLNYGIDFRGGTTIRTESTSPVDVAAYRAALETFGFSDVAVTEVFDPTFRDDQHVAQVRLSPIEGEEAVTPEVILQVEQALQQVDPSITFPSVESVGPKVSQELVLTAFMSVAAAVVAILVYIWLRFEWQFSVGLVAALMHDVIVTIGIFVLFQIKFDLTTVAALLTILGYSVNDTVVIFDRLRAAREPHQVQAAAAARPDEPVGQRDAEPDDHDCRDHADRAFGAADPGRGRDPGLHLRDVRRRDPWHLLDALCRQEHRADAGREAELDQGEGRAGGGDAVRQVLRRRSPCA